MSSRSEGRTIAGEADARACLGAQEESGLTLSAWAIENGVVAHSLYRWRQVVAGLDGAGIAGEGQARQLLDEWARSGRSLSEWCRAARVSKEALDRWRQQLERAGQAAPPGRRRRSPASSSTAQLPAVRLVEMAMEPELVDAPAEEPAAVGYEIRVGRCRVLLGRDFDDTVLTRLLRVAAAC